MDEELRKLRRIPHPYRWLGGICAGIAYCLGIEVWVTRLIFALLLFALHFYILMPYVLFWIFLPKWKETPEDFEEVTGD